MASMFSGAATNGGSRGAAYPAAPQSGLLFDSPSFSRKTATKWAAAEQRVSAACMVLGVVLLIASLRYAYHLTEVTGWALGALLLASGATGWWGGRRRSSNLTNLQLVGCLVGTLLAFGLISEVVRDTQVDCALAELYARGRSTEKALSAVQAEELHGALFRRLSEMEDQMSWVQQGAAKTAELQRAQQELRATDTTYIRHRVDMLKRHAQELLDSVLKHPDVTVENIQRLSEEEKAVLRRRMETADRVIDRLNKHEASKQEELSFDEYQQILADLTDADVMPAHKATDTELSQAKLELPNAKAAMERSKSDAYHTLLVGEAHHELQRLDSKRQQQREKFEEEFLQLMAQRDQRARPDYAADLPEHCLRETAGERLMVLAGLAAIALQVASAYVALSLSFRLPTKAA